MQALLSHLTTSQFGLKRYIVFLYYHMLVHKAWLSRSTSVGQPYKMFFYKPILDGIVPKVRTSLLVRFTEIYLISISPEYLCQTITAQEGLYPGNPGLMVTTIVMAGSQS